jgi:hypothetical protein
LEKAGHFIYERMELIRVLLHSSRCAEFHAAFFLLALHDAGGIIPLCGRFYCPSLLA